MSIVLAALAFLMEPSALSEAPAFGVDVVRVEAGVLTKVPIVGGDHDRVRLVCGDGVLAYAADSLSDGDIVQMMAGPVPLDGPFVTHCTLRSAESSDVLIVAYAGP